MLEKHAEIRSDEVVSVIQVMGNERMFAYNPEAQPIQIIPASQRGPVP
jgi:hypothetical protein